MQIIINISEEYIEALKSCKNFKGTPAMSEMIYDAIRNGTIVSNNKEEGKDEF